MKNQILSSPTSQTSPTSPTVPAAVTPGSAGRLTGFTSPAAQAPPSVPSVQSVAAPVPPSARSSLLRRHAQVHNMTAAEADQHVPAEQSMNCPACYRKHLACALEYAEEIMHGHGGSIPPAASSSSFLFPPSSVPFALDHRPDLAKHLCAAEEHARELNPVHANALRGLRHDLDAREWSAITSDTNLLRRLWLESLSFTGELSVPAPAAVLPSSSFLVPRTQSAAPRKPCKPCGHRPAATPGSAGRLTGFPPPVPPAATRLPNLDIGHSVLDIGYSAVPVPPAVPSPSVKSVVSVPSVFDLVFPLADNSAAAPELRYALRSAAKNLRGLGRIFIVSKNLPAWLRTSDQSDQSDLSDRIIHVPCSDRAGWKDFNLIKKLLAACDAGVSEQFIFWSDDQFLMQPVDAAGLMPMHEGDAGSWTNEQWTAKFNSKPATCWWNRLQNTVKLLQAKGKTAYNFDSHHPTLYNRDQFKQLMQELDVLNESKHPAHGYTINTLYCNLAGYTPATPRGLIRCANCLPKPDTTFWNANEPTAWPAAEKYLKAAFPIPSPWETTPGSAGRLTGITSPAATRLPNLDIGHSVLDIGYSAVPSPSVPPSVPSVPSVAAPGSLAVPAVPLTALTCTGDRPVQFGICLKIMERMNPRPAQWLLVDDGKTPIAPELIPNWAQYIRREPQPGDPPMTLAKNILAGFEHLKYNTVAFIEDDDWYPLNYLAEQFKEAQGVEACGAAGRYYFQLVKNAASVFTRGFAITASLLLNSAEAVKTYRQVCIDQPDGNGLDVLFWRHFTGKKRLHSNISATSVGIKDWPAGRSPGFAPTHVSSKGFTPDPQRKYLRQWLPPAELTWYNPENLK